MWRIVMSMGLVVVLVGVKAVEPEAQIAAFAPIQTYRMSVPAIEARQQPATITAVPATVTSTATPDPNAPTMTPTATSTTTRTSVPTATNTATRTSTATATRTATVTPIPTATNTPCAPTGGLLNPGFETATAWTYLGPAGRTTAQTFAGSWSGSTGGLVSSSGVIRQLAAEIPPWAQTARITWRLRMATNETTTTTEYDGLGIIAMDETFTTTYALAEFSNLGARNTWQSWYTDIPNPQAIAGKRLYVGPWR